MKIFNLFRGELDRAVDRDGWNSRAGSVGGTLGAELLGGTIYELEPANRLFPYHLHHANEEWLLVVRGAPTLRSPDSEQQLEEGDVVVFPRGAAGAHQVSNATDAPVRVLALLAEPPGRRRVSGLREGRGAQRHRPAHPAEPPGPDARLLGRRGLKSDY